MLVSELSKIRGFYTLAETTAVGSHNTFPNCRTGERILRCCNYSARFSSLSDRDQVEDDAWNQSKAQIYPAVFGYNYCTESRDGLCSYLRLRLVNTDGGSILLDPDQQKRTVDES